MHFYVHAARATNADDDDDDGSGGGGVGVGEYVVWWLCDGDLVGIYIGGASNVRRRRRRRRRVPSALVSQSASFLRVCCWAAGLPGKRQMVWREWMAVGGECACSFLFRAHT